MASRNTTTRATLRTIPVALQQFCCHGRPCQDRFDIAHVDTLLRLVIRGGGAATLAALVALIVSKAPLGSPLFFALTAVPCIVYGLLLRRLLAAPAPVRAEPDPNRRLLITALLLSVAFRVPPALGPVGPDNDMVRYVYDGRLQR